MTSRHLAVAVAAILAQQAVTETVPDRRGAILSDRASLEYDPRWIYDDSERGFAEARRTGKPLLIVLRCIPCLACAGIDAKVVVEGTELSSLLDQFVCVRLINANALDLARFQFDFDLSFTVMLFNADGTVYARYGSWRHQKDPKDEAIDGFRHTLERTLELHRGYPANRAWLEGKQGKPMRYRTPLELPTLEGKYLRQLDWEGKLVASCVHCHQIGDALRAAYREEKQPLPSNLVYPFPPPETIGLELAPDQAARVAAVTPHSVADQAGLRSGDEILRLDGQAITSLADVSWVLHHAGDDGALAAVIQRDGAPRDVTLNLPAGWRTHADIARRVGTWGMRAMALGGLFLEDLADEERTRRNLRADQLALFVKHVGDYGEHAAAKKAGFKKEDVIVAIAGSDRRETESQLIGRLLRAARPGDQVKATIVRGQERIELSLPMQ